MMRISFLVFEFDNGRGTFSRTNWIFFAFTLVNDQHSHFFHFLIRLPEAGLTPETLNPLSSTLNPEP